MIKELYHQTKLRAIPMDIKTKNILIILKIFKMVKNISVGIIRSNNI